MRILPAFRGALLCFFVSLLFAGTFCYGDGKTVEVVGIGECADCAESNIKTNQVPSWPHTYSFPPKTFPPLPPKVYPPFPPKEPKPKPPEPKPKPPEPKPKPPEPKPKPPQPKPEPKPKPPQPKPFPPLPKLPPKVFPHPKFGKWPPPSPTH